jgi:hypothetical protein
VTEGGCVLPWEVLDFFKAKFTKPGGDRAETGVEEGALEAVVLSWPVVRFLLWVGLFLLAVYLVFHVVQTLRMLRQTLVQVQDFLNHSGEVVRNLKSITYKLDRQLDDTGVITRKVRRSVEDLAGVLETLGRLTGRSWMAFLSLLAPVWWWRRRRRK